MLWKDRIIRLGPLLNGLASCRGTCLSRGAIRTTSSQRAGARGDGHRPERPALSSAPSRQPSARSCLGLSTGSGAGRGLGQSLELRQSRCGPVLSASVPKAERLAQGREACTGGGRDSTPARGSLQPRGGGGACACSSWRLGAAGEGGRVPSPVTATTEDDVDPSGKEAWAAEGQDARRPALGHRLAPFQHPLREGVPGRVGDARRRRRSPGSVSSRRPGDRPFPTAGSRAGGAGVGGWHGGLSQRGPAGAEWGAGRSSPSSRQRSRVPSR